MVLRMQLGSINSHGGTRSSNLVDLVDAVPVLLVAQENNHGRVVGHPVRRRDELMLLTKKVTLMEKGRRHQM